MNDTSPSPVVGIIMGSLSDWDTMREAADILDQAGIPYETRIVSAHRTPDRLFAYAEQAESRGLQVIIAGAGGAAHLPGMTAAKSLLPVLGVPIKTGTLGGIDSLLSIVQMPAGIPVGSLAIGQAGAKNAALMAISILGVKDPACRVWLGDYRKKQADKVLANGDPRQNGAGHSRTNDTH